MAIPGKPSLRLILGTLTIGPDPDHGGELTDLDEFKGVLDDLLARGYNEIDCAQVHCGGQQEAFTAKAGWKQRGLKLATKNYPHSKHDHLPEKLVVKIDDSLAQLETERVDIFYLHNTDRTLPLQPTLKVVDDAYRAGKFNTFGLSNMTAAEAVEISLVCKYNGWVRPTLFQFQYNAISRDGELELLPTLRRFGFDIVVYNPTAGGFFTGDFTDMDSGGSKGRFSVYSPYGSYYRPKYFKPCFFEAMRLIQQVCRDHQINGMEVAFRWLVHHSLLRMSNKGGNDGILIGISKRAQLSQNLDYCERGPLPLAILDALDKAWAMVRGDCVPYYHGPVVYGYDTVSSIYGENVL